ncbi:MupA/Atu3671 family FMN-dependent luciferase-like monooxygenase [Sulfitobacter sp. JB4-11]|uniref:MupA/Atu3671 family FMN-dependent luciferase-like monooxygenase n=1 Tax=Sulfitobacter rhodophyticola TaxID=3238304 RepID=UPI003514C516
MDFGLFYFANDEKGGGRDKYDLILKSAKWADQNGFVRLWTPERHFHSFGGLSPNPSVLASALAATTENIQICSGSVVLPLHDPIRVAEEWAVVDNISNGRVGLGVACGWVPNDFVISQNQDQFDCRKETFAKHTATLRDLWRGKPHRVTNPMGEEIDVQTLPRPIQEEVPIWITAAANPDTFRQAGAMGANILTHLLGQTVQELEEKIVRYRQAWADAGHSGQGVVSLMLHTFIGDSDESVHEIVRDPMKRYLAGSLNLAAANIASVPFLKDADKIDVGGLTDDIVDQTLEASFEKYFNMAGLLGSYEKCLGMVDQLAQMDVDEVACLIDFGVPEDAVMQSLEKLNVVRILANS